MMDMEKFAEEVLAAVREKGSGGFCAQRITAEKNNGITLAGITGGMAGSIIEPYVYLDEYYEKCGKEWMTVNEVAEDVYRRILKHGNDLKGVDADEFCKWERVKPRIHAKLINMEKNKGMLARMPWEQFLDLAVVYYVKIDGVIGGVEACFLVKNSHMEIWKQDEQGLYHAAMENMHKDGGPLLESIETVIHELTGDDTLPIISGPLNMGMYVLSNRRKIFGAAEILDRGTLEMVSDKMGGDFIVLPSSIHESIIISSDESFSHPELAAMVHGINRTHVDAEERLSDHIYLYEREKGALEIAA